MFKTTRIICLKSDNLSSTESGCEKIRVAANIKRDIMLERLGNLKNIHLFSYDVSNNCYPYCKRSPDSSPDSSPESLPDTSPDTSFQKDIR